MRVKTRTLSALVADPDGVAVDQPIAIGGAAIDIDAIALSQVFDIALSTTAIALAQNPNNALSANAYALAQTYASGVALSLEAGAASISPSRRLSITATTNESGTNFTIVGTGVDSDGLPVTGEILAGPNNTTVVSVNAYSAITSITPDATEASDQITVGHPAYLDGGLTLEALAAALIPPRNISIVSGAAADFSNVAFTVTGVGNDGAALVEAIPAGPNNSTVSTTGFFSSVTSIALQRTAASVSANISAGYLANTVPQPATLNGVLGNGIGVYSDLFGPAYVTISSASDLSARTFTVVGLGQYGSPRSDVIAGPNNSTTRSANLYTSVLSVTPDDDAANNFSVGIDNGGGTALTLTAGAASLSPPRRLVFDSDGDAAQVIFTVVGTDRNGRAITETVTGVTTAGVTTQNIYASVTSITPDSADTASVFVGWGAETISAPIMLDHFRNPFNVGLGVDVTGTVNYTVQHCFDDLELGDLSRYPYDLGLVQDGDGTWYDHDSLAAQTADGDGNYAFAVEAVRLVMNSGTGSVTLRLMQSGPRG